MKRLALAFGLGAWLLLAVVAWRADDRAARAQGDGDDAGRYVAIGVILYDRQTGQEVYIYNASGYTPATPRPPLDTATPNATHTPEPPTPTLTPPATNTPRPSVTPSSTPGNPTPTQDTEPQPTPKDDAEKTCLLRTRNVRINERTEPRVSAPRTATSPIDTYSTIKIYEVVEADGYLWARSVYGWFVIRQGSDWWVDTIEATVGCEDVPGWPQDLAPPPPIARQQGVGWTTMLGYDPALYEAGESLRAAGYAPSIVLTDNAGEACAWAARNWRVIVRPWYVLGLGDDPDLTIPPEASAYARVEALAGYVTLLCADSANVTVQLTNETRFPSADYLNRWIVAACEVCDARGLSCLPVVFSVGTPELDWMPTLRPALAALVARDYALGYNAYGYARDALLCDTAAQHTVWRPRLMRLAAGEPFPRVVVTEAARGAGDVAPIVSDAACFVRSAAGVYDTVALWYTGHDSAWRDGRWYADAMRALVATL